MVVSSLISNLVIKIFAINLSVNYLITCVLKQEYKKLIIMLCIESYEFAETVN